MAGEGATTDRGRHARGPSEIPRAGWQDIAFRVKSEVARDNLSIIAAGVAFYSFLAIFPALAALVSIYGLITDPATLQQHITIIRSFLPAEAARLIHDELQRILQSHQATLGWSLAVAVALALWSAAKGMSSLIAAMNIVYDEDETRGFLRRSALALVLTLAAVLFVILFLFVTVGLPLVLSLLPWGAAVLVRALRWPLLVGAGVLALAALYRYGPDREKARWQWLSWGAVIATALWLVGSVLFSLYASHFASYNSTYGSLGVVVIMMTWLLLSAYCVLLGGKINAEMEHQTLEDTTEGAAKFKGRRRA
jgi:membrane protein